LPVTGGSVQCFKGGIKICSLQKNPLNIASAALLTNDAAYDKKHHINSSFDAFPHFTKANKNATPCRVARFVQ
jgi:hypothetical protein